MTKLIPDLRGKNQGIKSLKPFIVQCPDCGDCYHFQQSRLDADRDTSTRYLPFWPETKRAGRRCLDCWAKLGWITRDSRVVFEARQDEIKKNLAETAKNRHRDRIPLKEALRLIAEGEKYE